MSGITPVDGGHEKIRRNRKKVLVAKNRRSSVSIVGVILLLFTENLGVATTTAASLKHDNNNGSLNQDSHSLSNPTGSVLVPPLIVTRTSSTGKIDTGERSSSGRRENKVRRASTSSVSAAAFDGGTKTVHYRVTWEVSSDDNACNVRGSEPAFTVTCPVGVLIVAPPETGQCTVNNVQSAFCFGIEPTGQFEVKCYGNSASATALQVEMVELAGAYLCEKRLRLETSHRVGFSSTETTFYGGTTTHELSISTSCGSGVWKEVSNPVCLAGNSNSELESCSLSDSCENAYRCDYFFVGPIISCRGLKVCRLKMPTSSVEVGQGYLSGIDDGCIQDIAVDLPFGSSCEYNVECDSNVCIEGKCVSAKLEDNAPCAEGDNLDCVSGACGGQTMEQANSLVCCDTGRTKRNPKDGTFICTGQAPDSSCFRDSLCASEVCIYGVCATGQRTEKQQCQNDNHCSGETACATWFSKTRNSCCPSEATFADDDVTFCSGLPTNEFCHVDGMCSSGACALLTYTANSKVGCCESGSKAEVTKPGASSRWDDAYYCAGVPDGGLCGANEMCDSGVCVGGQCAEGLREPQQTCDDDADCAAGQNDGGLSACALLTYTADAKVGCCASGFKAEVTKPGATSSWDDAYYCAGLVEGGLCGANEMCDSGVCVSGRCASGLREPQQTCDDDADCVAGQNDNGLSACALLAYTGNAKVGCCASGLKAEVTKPSATSRWDDAYYCAGLPEGGLCGANEMCDSNVCVSGQCAEGLRAPEQTCDDDADCVAGQNDNGLSACALLAYTGNAKVGCCASGLKAEVTKPGAASSWDDAYYCAGLPEGGLCGANAMCESNVCQGGRCADGLREPGEPCDDDADCVAGTSGRSACSVLTYETGASTGCCASGLKAEVTKPGATSSWDDAYYCASLPEGALCGGNSMCESSVCNGGQCASGLRRPGESCDDDADCVAGTSGRSACSVLTYATGATTGCCASGLKAEVTKPGATSRWDDAYYCAGLPEGGLCGANSMCESNVCQGGRCAAGLQQPGEPCDDDADCVAGTSGRSACSVLTYETGASTGCCASGLKEEVTKPGATSRWDDAYYCAGLPEGGLCGANSMCASNVCQGGRCADGLQQPGEPCDDDADCVAGTSGRSACSVLTYETGASTGCCASGLKAEVTKPGATSRWDDAYYCAGLPEGALCGGNSMCESSVCNGGQCASGLRRPGESCDDDADCVTGTSGRSACSVLTYETGATTGCCASGLKAEVMKPGATSRWDDAYYCAGLPEGGLCGANSMCESNVCNGGKCASGIRQPGESCDDDADCAAGTSGRSACSLLTYKSGASAGCCPSGLKVEVTKPGATSRWDDAYYCAGLPEGALCGANSMCESSVCNGGKCAGGARQPGESCDDDADCVAGTSGRSACSLLTYETGASVGCCPSGLKVEVTKPGATSRWDDAYYCAGLPEGGLCGADTMCGSSVCGSGQCK